MYINLNEYFLNYAFASLLLAIPAWSTVKNSKQATLTTDNSLPIPRAPSYFLYFVSQH
jgi:hypothetical protein